MPASELPAPIAPEHYRAFLDLVRIPAGAGREVVYAPSSRTAHLLTGEQLGLLSACRAPLPLAAHAARIAAALRPGGAPVGPVLAALEALAAEGLLVSDTAIVRMLRQSAVARPTPPPIATLAIPTENRIESLVASLASYIEDSVIHRHPMDYLVVDSTADPDIERRTRAAVEALRARTGAPVSYAGRPEKERYAEALAAEAGVAPALIEFALFNPDRVGFAAGSNRNAILLHTAGDLCAMADDDTSCPIAPVPSIAPGLAITSQQEPSELWFPQPGEPVMPPLPAEPVGFAAAHASLLGKDVGTLAIEHPGGLDPSRAAGMFFRRLMSGGGRVLTTQTGGAGDSGTGSMWHTLMLAGPSRERLHASEAAYRHAFVSRIVVRAAVRPSIGDGLFCMTMGIGVDNRDLTPPEMPICRNGDGIYGVLIRLCFHDAYIGFLPWVVRHAPPTARSSPFEELWSSLRRTPANDMICHLLLGSRLEADKLSPRENLRTLGAILQRWASQPHADFEEIVRMHVLRARAHDLVTLDEILRRYGRKPDYWARDIDRTAEALRNAITSPALAWPSDLVEQFGEERGRALFQTYVRKLGELLQAWPDLVEAAKRLRQKGVRLVNPGRA
ncbi:MAG: hypothetical protein U0359_32990 [Byssovorax sp.]